MAWLVAGLGNPGERYATTRHNVGRMVADALVRDADARYRKVRFLPVEAAELRLGDERVIVARSIRYMNEAGPGYASLAKKHGIEPERVIAVHDELDIPAGTIRVKRGGGTSGHNGVRSMAGGFGTPGFLRVRVGIGRPPGRQDPADFVLQPIAKRDHPDMELLLAHAADAVRALVADGLERTQDRYNRSTPSPEGATSS
ncbi:MAG TPA: aminoacyl-tRNA hydrolase [Actinomycetota bacterium]|nr:aminoacyl-tRNA hydrolase [Actinomycetota bacterium]